MTEKDLVPLHTMKHLICTNKYLDKNEYTKQALPPFEQERNGEEDNF